MREPGRDEGAGLAELRSLCPGPSDLASGAEGATRGARQVTTGTGRGVRGVPGHNRGCPGACASSGAGLLRSEGRWFCGSVILGAGPVWSQCTCASVTLGAWSLGSQGCSGMWWCPHIPLYP